MKSDYDKLIGDILDLVRRNGDSIIFAVTDKKLKTYGSVLEGNSRDIIALLTTLMLERQNEGLIEVVEESIKVARAMKENIDKEEKRKRKNKSNKILN